MLTLPFKVSKVYYAFTTGCPLMEIRHNHTQLLVAHPLHDNLSPTLTALRYLRRTRGASGEGHRVATAITFTHYLTRPKLS